MTLIIKLLLAQVIALISITAHVSLTNFLKSGDPSSLEI